MRTIHQFTNKELVKELVRRMESKEIDFFAEKNKEQGKILAKAYQEWANDPEEQKEIDDWKKVESDGWDD